MYDYLNPKSPRHDPTFPKPVKLGASAVGWIDHEVTAWLESRIAASRQDDANPEARHATQSPRNLSSQGEK
ncbi:helix-turn-helix transcriptional regulator [Paraburkholderia fungorum]|uniref:helix-turn-helix transcriptional regulator n=1 Tax=Paraburkholderia fungorum TaxID=134537 RepID=UPI002117107E